MNANLTHVVAGPPSRLHGLVLASSTQCERDRFRAFSFDRLTTIMANRDAGVWNYAVNRYAEGLALQAFFTACNDLTPEQRALAAGNGLDSQAAIAGLQSAVDTRAVVHQLISDHLGGEQEYAQEDMPIDQAYADALAFMVGYPNPFGNEMRRIFGAYL